MNKTLIVVFDHGILGGDSGDDSPETRRFGE